MLIGGIALVSAVAALGVCLSAGGFQGLAFLWILPLAFVGVFLVGLALAFAFLWGMCAIVDLDKPQEQDSRFYRQMMYLYIDAIITLVRLRVHTRGLEQTPKDGRFLLVCNHLNDVDPAILLAHFKKSQLAFISKQENRDMFIVGPVMHKTLCQMVNRENDREALKTILKCVQLIKDDQVSVAVFPEGYVSLDGKLHHFRGGVFKIAQKTKVPIVVCTLKNTKTVIPNMLKLKPSDVDLHLVGVLRPEELEGCTTLQISQRVYDMMLEDLGPEFAPVEQNT